jgi:radical SAM superfamily enzyme YgiQ (UPF0313 family)
MKKITFIRPNMSDMRSSDAMEPMVFAILASRTPRDIDVVLHDDRLSPIPFDDPTDLVAMTVETFTARRAYQIAAKFRERGVKVVMGGYHPTFVPDEALRFADAIVVGDAEGLWEQVVSDAGAGALQRCYRQSEQPSLAALMPDRTIFRGKRYAPLSLVQFGRGCRFACDFCSIHAFYGSNLRQRPVREVVTEIESLERRHIFFVDDNIFVDVPRAEALFRALVPLRIKWSCQVSIDVARNDALLALMERSGCTTAVVGFESLDARNLAQMNKKWNLKYADYATSIRRLHDHGVMIYGTFVFGYDYDTVDAFERNVEFALRSKFFLANFNPLTPTPGARLFDRLREERRLIHDRWWLDPAYQYGHATFRPRGMTPDELTEGCFWARRQFFRYSSIGRRVLDPATNCRSVHRLGLYLAANLISRREILRKQNRNLGERTPVEQLSVEQG